MAKLVQRDFAIIVLILLLSFPAYFRLLKPGYFSMHDDVQIMGMFEMNKCFSDGQIPCRWVPDMGAGYGHPLFNYHPVFPYYLGEFFRIFNVSFIDTIKISFLLSLGLSGIFMYLLAKDFFGKLGGFLSATFFVYTPYRSVDIFVRGDLTESWAICFFPLILLGIYRYLKERKFYWFLVAVFSLTGLFLPHNIMTMLFVPIVIAFSAYWSSALKRPTNIFRIGLVFSSAIGLAAFFIFPSFFELPLVNVLQNSGYYDFHNHFVTVSQLFLNRNFGYGPSIPGPNDTLSFQIGWPHWWIIFTIPLVLYYLNKKREHLLFGITSLFLLFLIGAVVMTHARSVWVPLLRFVQFPLRFLALIIFTASFLAGGLIFSLKGKLKLLVAASLIIATVALNYQYFTPEKYYPQMTDRQMLSGDNFKRQSITTLLDYVPKNVQKLPSQLASDLPVVKNGNAAVGPIQKGSNWWYFNADNKTSKTEELEVPVFYFPDWEVSINGKKAPFPTAPASGLITVNILPGRNLVQGKLFNTPMRSAADLASLISLAIIFAVSVVNLLGIKRVRKRLSK